MLKIRTLLLLSSLVLILISAAVVLTVFLASVYTDRLVVQNRHAESIVDSAYTLKVLAQEYITNYEDRPKQQWYLQHKVLMDELRDPALQRLPASAFVADLVAEASALERTFNTLTERSVEAAGNPALERQLSGELAIEAQRMVLRANQLTDRTLEERTRARTMTDRLIMVLLGIMALTANAIIVVLFRRIMGSLERMQKGTQAVGKGDLSYRINNFDNCEIGELSRAFDGMTSKLKRSYDTLEEQVAVRTRDLEALSRKNEILLKSIGDGVFVIDKNWKITFWNDAAEQISGWTSEEAVGRDFGSIVKFVRVADKSSNVDFIREAMRTGEPRMMETGTLLIRKDGTEVAVGDSVAPVFDVVDGKRDKVTGAIVVFRDTTAQNALAQKEAQIIKLKDDFLFRTIHDLRSPTSSIRLALDAHAEEEAALHNPVLERTVGMIREASGRMQKLINDLLEIAKGENAEVMLRLEPADLCSVTREVIEQLAPQMKEKGITLEYVEPKKKPVVMADTEALKEVLDNLLNNAIKYNKTGGAVSLKHEYDGLFVRTTVKDGGIGIRAESMDKLFTPYYRAAGREIPGTGLGLYIVRKLVEKMSGQISIASKLGEGTTVVFTLPIAKA